MMWVGALALLSASVLCAQDIAGDWQGTLKLPAAEIRIGFTIEKGADGGWKQLPTSRLYGELGLVNLVGLIPSIAVPGRESS